MNTNDDRNGRPLMVFDASFAYESARDSLKQTRAELAAWEKGGAKAWEELTGVRCPASTYFEVLRVQEKRLIRDFGLS